MWWGKERGCIERRVNKSGKGYKKPGWKMRDTGTQVRHAKTIRTVPSDARTLGPDLYHSHYSLHHSLQIFLNHMDNVLRSIPDQL